MLASFYLHAHACFLIYACMETKPIPNRRAGGEARARKLSSEEKQNIARRAAESRWMKDIPPASHEGSIRLGELEIPCAVLEDGTRLLTQQGFLMALGRSRTAKGGQGSSVDGVIPFLAAKNLSPLVTNELRESTKPIFFRPLTGGRAFGYKAELLPEICDIYLDARDKKILHPSQALVAKQAETIMRGLARVGIAALVDEATGYQSIRAADALAKILKDFIAEDYRKWTQTFPLDFYTQIARLKGWTVRQDNGSYRWPQVVGHYTNNFVYDRLAPGVLDELRRKNPNFGGRRKHKHHQWLTGEVGHPRLMAHLEGVRMIMRFCDSWEQFIERVDKEYPRYKMTELGFEVEIKSNARREQA